MFGTLRYEPQSNAASFQAGAYTPHHSACDTCRARKLRCGGQRNGCDRCKSNSTPCTYTEAGSSNRRHGKHGAASRQPVRATSENAQTTSRIGRSRALASARKTSSGPEPDGRLGDVTATSENNAFSPFTSPVQSFDEDLLNIFDQTMHDLLPDLNHSAMEDCPGLQQYPIPMGADDLKDYPIDFYPSPEHTSPSSDETYPSSLPELNPFTMANMVLPQPEGQREAQQAQRARPSPVSNASSTRSQMLQSRPQAATQWQPQRTLDKAPSFCTCVQTILELLEELENRTGTADMQELDAILAHQKKALKHCAQVQRCAGYIARSDHMVLLGVVSDKLIATFEQLVGRNMNRIRGGRGSSRHGAKADGESGKDDDEGARGHGTSSSESMGAEREGEDDGDGESEGRDGHSPRHSVSFGCYKIDMVTEWDYVGRVLMTLQLRQVFRLLSVMQAAAGGTSRGPQIAAIRLRKQRLAAVMDRIKRDEKS